MFSAQSNPLIPSLAKCFLAAKEITLGKNNRIFKTETLAIDPECILWHCLAFALYIFILVLMCCSVFLKNCSLSPALQDLSLQRQAAGSHSSAPDHSPRQSSSEQGWARDNFDLFNWSARQVIGTVSAMLLGEQRQYLIWFEVHFSVLTNSS